MLQGPPANFWLANAPPCSPPCAGDFAEFGSVAAQGPLHGGGLVQRVMGRGGLGGTCHLRCPQRLFPWLQRCSASVPRSASSTRQFLLPIGVIEQASISRPSPAPGRRSPLASAPA